MTNTSSHTPADSVHYQADDVVIVGALRSAIAKFSGALQSLSASDIGAQVMQVLLAKTGVPAERISEVILGQVLTAGCGQNPARQTVIKAGLPNTVPAMTINQVCGSGLRAVMLAAQAIQINQAEIVIAGGQESMSQAPYLLPSMRQGARMGDAKAIDSMIYDGLWDVFNQYHMGITAENVAQKYGITRQAQDELAYQSQQKAIAAQKAGAFEAEIAPIHIAQRKGEPIVFRHDEFIRHDCTLESLQSLKPAFNKDGSVTAGNASGINDGAAMLMLMRFETAQNLNLPILGKIAASATSGLAPEIMGMGPVSASQKCLERATWNIDQLDLMEINEAFAAQALAVHQVMGWNMDKINVHGGAIALGHPIGASGARVLVTLLHAMQKRQARRGLTSLCIGGGMGVALAVENLF